MSTLTGHRPATMPNAIRISPTAGLAQALRDSERTLDASLNDLYLEVHGAAELVGFYLDYSELFHTESEVMLLGKFLLAANRVDLAVALLAAWSLSPYRD